MKISSKTNSQPSAPAVLGQDIVKPGLYRRSGNSAHSLRLIVLSSDEKFVYFPDAHDGMKLQVAGGALNCEWVPVKEKLTITFDTTEE